MVPSAPSCPADCLPTSTSIVRQLARELDIDSANLSRELARLEKAGLLRSDIEGRLCYYWINRQYPNI